MTLKGYSTQNNSSLICIKNIMPITIGIVEDHSAFRESLVYLVSSYADYSIAWAYPSVEEALAKFTPADVMLLDIYLPGMTGLEGIPLFRKKSSSVKIIMLTILEDDLHILEAIKRGADGYILKKTNPSKLLDAIEQVYEGGAALTPMVAKQVLAFLKPELPKPESSSNLTTRETEILKLITSGLSNETIAGKLFISVQTVRNHIKSIYDKLQVHTRAQVVVKALKEGMV